MPFVYPSPTPVLPPLHGFSVFKKPMFASNVVQTVSGREFQGIQQAFPLWEFTLNYEVLRSETQNIVTYQQFRDLVEVEQIATLYNACAGQYGRFWFDDWSDNSRTGQYIATGNGVLDTFRVRRDWGVGSLMVRERVGAVNTDEPINVYLDGVLQSPSTWQILPPLKVSVVFDDPVPNGVVITMDFNFYYRCRFLEDEANFDQFMYNLWQLRSFRFRSTKGEGTGSDDDAD